MPRLIALLALTLLALCPHPAPAQTPAAAPIPAPATMLDAVRHEGRLPCGVIDAEDDWNYADLHGDISGFGTEICRAVATAILGDPAKADIVHFPAEPEALDNIKSGAIALVVGVSPSDEVATQYGAAFGQPVFLDTLRFLVAEANHLHSLDDLRDRVVCAMANSGAERTLRDEMTARHITFGLQSHSEQGEMYAAVAVAHCAAGAALETRLADARADFPASAPPFTFLPERIGIDPIVPAWRYGDQKFGLIVDATVSALLEAEALGLTQANIGESLDRHDQRADRLLGHDNAVALATGVADDWAVHVIQAVGNYGEIFARTLTKPLRLERGYNALWTQGGLLYPKPLH